MRRWIMVGATLLTLAILSSQVAGSTAATHSASERERITRDYRARGFSILWNEDLSVARKILAPLSPNPDSKPVAGTPEEIAAEFLRQHADVLLGTPGIGVISGRDESSVVLRTIRVRESLFGSHVWKQQFVSGVPVDGALVCVNIDRDGRVTSVRSEFRPDIRGIDFAPTVTETNAREIARDSLAPHGAISVESTPELMVYAHHESPRLVWKVPHGAWLIMVDARSGEIVHQRDRLIRSNPAKGIPDASLPIAQPDETGFRTLRKVSGTGYVLPMNPLNNHPERYHLRDGDPVDGYRESRTIHRLDGSGYLRGDYADVFPPTATRAQEPSLVFEFSADEEGSHFHEVNAYWHIDEYQNYLQTVLGISNANNRQTRVYVHYPGSTFYHQGAKLVAYGDDGVDDSEDGELVLWLYGIAIYDNIVSDYVDEGESGAIGWGFGQFLACSYAESPLLAEWDAVTYNPGPPPYSRNLNNLLHYPEDMTGYTYYDGRIIALAWWELRKLVGAEISEKLVIESAFLLGVEPTFEDFADATIQVDQTLYGGVHFPKILAAYGDRGIGSEYILEIQHDPQPDTEDIAGPYPILAAVAHTFPLVSPDPVQLHWRFAGEALWNNVVMDSTGVDEWSGDIPGPGANATIEYYISADDVEFRDTTHPLDAPRSFHSFYVGPDAEPPVITHTPLWDQSRLRWPTTARATVTDNAELASVEAGWTRNGVTQPSFAMANLGDDLFGGEFPFLGTPMAVGDIIEYTITAADNSSNANTTSEGPHVFEIIDARGAVLVSENGWSGSYIATLLAQAGYVVTLEDASASYPARWPDYDLVVSSSGGEWSPMQDRDYRRALEDYVLSGHKLLVEGGNVGHEVIQDLKDLSFAANVLHVAAFHGDFIGSAIAGVPGTENHPLRTAPHTLPNHMEVLNGEQHADSMEPTPDAYHVFGASNAPENAGVNVFDDNVSPLSAQIVYFALRFDSGLPEPLLENTVEYLLAGEDPSSASIGGQVVLLGTADHSGTTITLNPGNHTVVTSSDGRFSMGPMPSRVYQLVLEGPTGWETTIQSIGLARGDELTDADFELRRFATDTLCESPNLLIPDGDPDGVTTTMDVAFDGEITGITCSLDVTTGRPADLIIELVSPVGTRVRLHNRTGGYDPDILTSYDDLTMSDGPGSMADFLGEDMLGTWTLFASDNLGGRTATINEWCLTPTVLLNEEPVGVEPPPPAPKVYRLEPNFPNPFNPATRIQFDLPRPGSTSLRIYDVTGRLVRVLAEGELPAGTHTYRWTGTDDRGVNVASGTYFYRVESGDFVATRSMVLLK